MPIGSKQVIRPVDLEPVPREIDEGYVVAAERGREILESRSPARRIGLLDQLDLVDRGPAQRGCDHTPVGDRIVQLQPAVGRLGIIGRKQQCFHIGAGRCRGRKQRTGQ